MSKPVSLQPGRYYHIYNRGNNRENLFKEERNYHHFLKLYVRYIPLIADTYAYCLLKNHFHVLVRLKTAAEQARSPQAVTYSQQFGNLFNAYSKAMNKAYGRTGSLFEHPFERIEVQTKSHLLHLVPYIHRNPQTHRLIADFRDWPFSSYQLLCSTRPTYLRREPVLTWFGGRDEFAEAHRRAEDVQGWVALRLEDFE